MSSKKNGGGVYGNVSAGSARPPDSISLLNFFVFNASLCRREGEEEKKILYYYPAEEDVDRKIKNIGLCEAVAKFTETFAPKTPVETIHSQKKRMMLHEPEAGYWMVLTVSVPFGKSAAPPPADKDAGSNDKENKGTEYEYQEDDVSDKVLLSVLHHCYKMFKLFMGTFGHIVATASHPILSSRLEHFFSRYLLNLRLHSADLLDVFGGIHFLPLDKTTFLRIQCFINSVEERFPAVKYTAFLYNDLLVWSSLAQVDIRILYSYLTKSLLRESAHLEYELGTALSTAHTAGSRLSHPTIHYPVSPRTEAPSTPPKRGGGGGGGGTSSSRSSPSTPSSTSRAYGSFITGPSTGLKNSVDIPIRVPRVFVNTSLPNEECHLVVYRSLSATLCLLTDADFSLTHDFYAELEAYLGQPMTDLASDIGEQYTRNASHSTRNAADPHHHYPPQTNWKYLYFNHMNLAQKTSFHAGGSGGGSSAGTPSGAAGGVGSWGWDEGKDSSKDSSASSSPAVAEILGLLSDINTDLNRMEGGGGSGDGSGGCSSDGETIVKTYRDQWVVGKKSDEREVYVVIHQKHANLIEINEQLKTICNSHFNNIFFLD